MTANFKTLVKRLTPKPVLNVYRGIKYDAWLRRPKYFWEGVFENFEDVPVTGEGFLSDSWFDWVRANTNRVLAESKTDATVPAVGTGEQQLLPMLAVLLAQNAKRNKLRILDFGGGLGIDYVRVISGALDSRDFDYHIVDTERSCEVGSELFAGDHRVHFHESTPQNLEVDLVYLNSVLAFIRDYKTVLEALCRCRPKLFLFVRLDAGDIPTHARGQINIEGSIVPCWFFNIKELINIMKSHGYSPIFKGVAEVMYDESNLPAEYRLGRACNLLFSRIGDESQSVPS